MAALVMPRSMGRCPSWCNLLDRVIRTKWGLTPGVAVRHVVHMPKSVHVTVVQAAKILGVSRWTVLRALKDGRLRGEKLGENTATWLLDRADVEALRDARGGSEEVA
jgi:excisionase family DNA binding protein